MNTITLIAIHGNGGGGFRFERVRPHLPPDIILHTPTLPGFDGVSPNPAYTTLRDYAEHLYQEIESLPHPRVLLGHGIGGAIVLELVQHHTNAVDAFILHAPVGARLDKRLLPRLMNLPLARRMGQQMVAAEGIRPLWTRLLFSRPIPPDMRDRFFEAYGQSAAFGQMFEVITPTWFQGLQPITTPAALLWGAKEQVLSANHLNDFRRVLPDAVTRTVPNWGHFPMVEQPAEYATEVAALARQLTHTQEQPILVEHILWLGANAAASRGVGNKGALLDVAKAKGLPVPDGVMVRHEAYLSAQEANLIREETGKWIAPDSAALIRFLGLPRWRKAVAVRSAFSAEDTQQSALAGYFTSRLNVNSDNPDALASALCEVWSSGGSNTTIRRDILILEMVKAVRAGVAFTEPEYEDDVANIARGTAEKLVAGQEQGERLELPKLRGWERELPHLKLKAGPARLQRLLRDVRSAFGDTGWDIEWADDGTRCYLIQLRPITRPLRRNETFTLANHKEILPDLPSRFMATLIESCADGLFGWYRRFDPSLPATRPFIEVFYGRPLINLSLLEEMMRRWGLPTTLVTTNIGGGTASTAGFNPARLLRNLPVFLRLAQAQGFAIPTSQKTIDRLATLSLSPSSLFTPTIATLQTLYTELVNGMFALTTAMSVPLAILRRVGGLEQHQGHHETIATALYNDLAALRPFVTEEMRPLLAKGEVPDNGAFRTAWADFLANHGHRGIYESDIARPRYHEVPDPLLMALSIPITQNPTFQTGGSWLTAPLWRVASAFIRQREQLRYTAMLGFDRVRRQLLALAEQAVLRGQLPTVDHLWQLTITEAKRLDTGWKPEPSFWMEREAEIAALAPIALPDTLKRFEGLLASDTMLLNSERLVGLPLTKGTVTGRAWVLQEPTAILPDGFTPQTTILVARSVDAGWIATFGLVAGVVVETGGDLSHGSIILREIGLPAVTNVTGATRAFATGEKITLSAESGFVGRSPSP
jgi:pimeloyl-ACP methyl ester carboxylesterase/phosphohistidine swiveling domain-containing protein